MAPCKMSAAQAAPSAMGRPRRAARRRARARRPAIPASGEASKRPRSAKSPPRRPPKRPCSRRPRLRSTRARRSSYNSRAAGASPAQGCKHQCVPLRRRQRSPAASAGPGPSTPKWSNARIRSRSLCPHPRSPSHARTPAAPRHSPDSWCTRAAPGRRPATKRPISSNGRAAGSACRRPCAAASGASSSVIASASSRRKLRS
mmetsp:Transcript_85415/g.265564  ORF Transcript_85415/g.265564 Transcript_85415/m.265564 type:complete len:202 (-) Transcript_85415:107-712(-)